MISPSFPTDPLKPIHEEGVELAIKKFSRSGRVAVKRDIGICPESMPSKDGIADWMIIVVSW